MAASDQATYLKSSAKFPNKRAGLAAIVGLTISPLWSDAADALKTRPSADLPASNGPSCCPTCRRLSAADRMRLRARMSRLCLCDGGEGGGVSEPAPLRAPLEA